MDPLLYSPPRLFSTYAKLTLTSLGELHTQSSHGNLAVVERQRDGNFILNGKLGISCARVTKSRLYESWVRDHVVRLGMNESSSFQNCGSLVTMEVTNDMAAMYYY